VVYQSAAQPGYSPQTRRQLQQTKHILITLVAMKQFFSKSPILWVFGFFGFQVFFVFRLNQLASNVMGFEISIGPQLAVSHKSLFAPCIQHRIYQYLQICGFKSLKNLAIIKNLKLKKRSVE